MGVQTFAPAMVTPILDRAGWTAIADLGDLGVLLPLAGALALLLLVLRGFRASLAWAASVAFCIGAVAGGKALFGAFPSGHTAMSTVVYGGVAWLAWSTERPAGRLMSLLLITLVALIGTSVVVLGRHGPQDVLGGLVLGASLVGLLARHLIATPRQPQEAALAVATIVALLSTIYGTHAAYAFSLLKLVLFNGPF